MSARMLPATTARSRCSISRRSVTVIPVCGFDVCMRRGIRWDRKPRIDEYQDRIARLPWHDLGAAEPNEARRIADGEDRVAPLLAAVDITDLHTEHPSRDERVARFLERATPLRRVGLGGPLDLHREHVRSGRDVGKERVDGRGVEERVCE